MNICSNYFLEIENFVEWLVNCKEMLEMGLLKRIQESNATWVLIDHQNKLSGFKTIVLKSE